MLTRFAPRPRHAQVRRTSPWEAPLTVRIEPHPSPVSADERAQRLIDPGFGRVFTDHMVTIGWSRDGGWGEPLLHARRPLTIDPASAVLHYAQEIFEGLKAYRADDGAILLFRPEANAARFRASARRMAMPELPDDLFLSSIHALVGVDRDWVPAIDGGALYLRPFMVASEVFLGVKPASEHLYMLIASSVGGYFRSGAPAISLWVARAHSRAGAGGTGAAKCGGNYAASLIAQQEATAQGCDQVVFLDAAERRWVEELGGMNIFFVMRDGRVVTPALTGTILPGITRDSILSMLRDDGVPVEERGYSIDEWRADARSGALAEAFACGTAAVVTPIGSVRDGAGGDFAIGNGGPGSVTIDLRERLVAIQHGRASDPHGWRVPLALSSAPPAR